MDGRSPEVLASAQAGDDAARAAVVEAHLDLVRAIASRFRGVADWDDVIQTGCVGLLKALERYDPARGAPFGAYAASLVLGELRRFRRDDGPVHVGRRLRGLAARVRCRREALAQALGREPTFLELARDLDLPPEELVAALDAARAPVSLDAPLDPAGEVRVADRLADQGPAPDAAVDRLALAQAMDALPRRDRLLLVWRYFHGATQAQVAARLGLSQPQVSRLEARALAAVRDLLAG